MNTIEEYKIVKGIDSFDRGVNDALKGGWQPYGSPFTFAGTISVFCQAMVKFHQPTGGEKIAELRHV